MVSARSSVQEIERSINFVLWVLYYRASLSHVISLTHVCKEHVHALSFASISFSIHALLSRCSNNSVFDIAVSIEASLTARSEQMGWRPAMVDQKDRSFSALVCDN